MFDDELCDHAGLHQEETGWPGMVIAQANPSPKQRARARGWLSDPSDHLGPQHRAAHLAYKVVVRPGQCVTSSAGHETDRRAGDINRVKVIC